MSVEGSYLSEAINYESFKRGNLNLITAPCGSGKTVAAFISIPDYLKVEPHHSLVLINTTAGRDEFVNDGYAYYFENINGQEWKEEFDEEKINKLHKPIVMTYASFGAQIKKNNINLNNYDYIVCDELHTLNKYIGIERGNLRKQFPQAAPWEINDMLQVTCYTYIAVETIYELIKRKAIWIFALTATPNQLYKNDLKKISTLINEVEYSQKLHAYEIFCKFEYSEIEPILREIVPENRKRLFFFNTIKELKQYKQILLECGRAAEALWSNVSTTPMNQNQLTTRDYVLKEHRLPEDIQDLLINSAYETAINIKDDKLEEIYIHTGNKDTREQVRNRARQDIKKVGYYNSDMKKWKKKNTIRKEKLSLQSYIEQIPLCYFNIPLTAEDKKHLVDEIDFPKAWPTLKKTLIEQGYTVEDKSNGKLRYSIIKSK